MQNRFGRLEDLIPLFTKKSFYYQGFFAVKRRAVFILGAKWKTLVRGWRSDCVVGGMETRFQWRKAHSRTAKCEAFHVAPRLFFMFLIPFTIRQQCTIYPQGFSTEPNSCQKSFLLLKKMRFFYIFCRFCWIFFFFLCIFVVSFQGQSAGKCANLMPHWRWILALKKGYRKNKGILLIPRTLSLKIPFWLCQNDAITQL